MLPSTQQRTNGFANRCKTTVNTGLWGAVVRGGEGVGGAYPGVTDDWRADVFSELNRIDYRWKIEYVEIVNQNTQEVQNERFFNLD